MLIVLVSRPRDCRVSCTLDGVSVPVELESRTEKDSRRVWRRLGGSLDRGSDDDRVFANTGLD